VCNTYRTAGIEERSQMSKGFEEFQKVGEDGFDAAVRSFGEVNRVALTKTSRAPDLAISAHLMTEAEIDEFVDDALAELE